MGNIKVAYTMNLTIQSSTLNLQTDPRLRVTKYSLSRRQALFCKNNAHYIPPHFLLVKYPQTWTTQVFDYRFLRQVGLSTLAMRRKHRTVGILNAICMFTSELQFAFTSRTVKKLYSNTQIKIFQSLSRSILQLISGIHKE